MGDIYDAAFRIIRYNPGATVGAALLVSAISAIFPIAVTALLTRGLGIVMSMDPLTQAPLDAQVWGAVPLLLGVLAQSLATILVTGMVAHVTAAAALGRRLSLGQAWRATAGKRWRLVGSGVLLIVVFTVVGGALGAGLVALTFVIDSTTGGIVMAVLIWLVVLVAIMSWLWVRVYYLAAPPLMLEPLGVFGAIGRGFRLTRGQFWRVFGIALLTAVIVGVAGYMVALPIGFGFALASEAAGAEIGPLVTVVIDSLAQVVTSAFVAPFGAAVATLVYLDLRMRKEAYDVELMTRAGIARR